MTADFVLDEETNEVKVKDNQKVTIGGMITEKTIKYTKNNKDDGIHNDRGLVWNGGSDRIPEQIMKSTAPY